MSTGWDKIRQKCAPKVYKSGAPGPTGRDRLARRVNGLLADASRLQRNSPDADVVAWCEELVTRLRAFNDWARPRTP